MGQNEFARDATFGYTSSNLREFIAEKSASINAEDAADAVNAGNSAPAETAENAAAAGGYRAITADDVQSISLSDIREGGPERVARFLPG